MKKFLFSAIVTLIATTMAACGTDDSTDGEQTQTLEVTEGQTEQTTYADETEGTSGVTFVAAAPWTANVSENATRAGSVSWLRLKVNGEEAYSGGAGTINLVIEMDENDTANDRKATITISSGGSDIEINVSQKAKTIAEAIEDGEFEAEDRPAPVSGNVWKIVLTNNSMSETLTVDRDEARISVEGSVAYKRADDGTGETFRTILDAKRTTDYWMAISSVQFPTYTKEIHRYYYFGVNGASVDRRTEQVQDGGTSPAMEIKYAYNSDGGLEAILWPQDDGKTFRQSIIWKGGNPVVYPNYSVRYGDVANNPKCNIDINAMLVKFCTNGGMLIDYIMDGIDIFGKRSANMAAEYSYQDASGSYPGDSGTMEYELNEAGFISKITHVSDMDEVTTVNILYK